MSDVMSARCWHEDYEKDHENMYTVWCPSCRQPFYGYKRRVICKACHIKDIEKRLTELREANEISPDILSLAKSMQFKMDKNKNKPHKEMNPDGLGRHYDHLPISVLFDRLVDEVEELREAILNEPDGNIRLECADVANFAMMIHENLKP